MDKNHLKELFKQFDNSNLNHEKAYFNFFKVLTTICIGLIGLLIGLNKTPINNQFAKVAFLISLILIGFCIMFSLVVQFYEVISYKKEVEIRRMNILKYIDNPNENNLQIEILVKHRIYTIFEILTFVSLILSIFSLIIYSYYINFK
jgi:hypothetical protein